MKKSLFAIVMLLVASAAMNLVKAQDASVATLMHGDDLQVYYGASALQKAVEAAAPGDVINLSAGTFTGTNIDKALTIQGSGYADDYAHQRYLTAIHGNFSISIPTEQTGFMLEGVWSDGHISVYDTLSYATFTKDRLYSISFIGHTVGCSIDRCRIASYIDPDDESDNFFIRNSVIKAMHGNSDNATLLVRNCFCYNLHDHGVQGIFENNIMYNACNNSSCVARNNVYSTNYSMNAGISTNNWRLSYISEFSNIFKSPIREYSDTHMYELTDEAIANYIGTDGTQVGIHGGEIPFDDVPSNPQIESCEVAPQTDANGRLSVKIKVSAQ